uniref:IP5PC-F beta-propeller domain-containing protein n=1 Tax=Arcella intermedia TaxID=1963864 RepID=A0A6B2LA26_9EUKA
MRKEEAIILCSVFDPREEYFVAGTSAGDLSIWKMKDWMSENSFKDILPMATWQAHSGPIYSLAFSQNTLLSGGDDSIRGWNWDKLLESTKSGTADYEFQLINPNENPSPVFLQLTETNGLAVDDQTNHVYSATGYKRAYCWDIEYKKVLRTFEGHVDYLHCIKFNNANRNLVTGSEDGSVRIWDTRSTKSHTILDCNNGVVTQSFEARNENTNWVSCLDVDETGNWLVCGGGFCDLTMWYLPMPSVTCHMPSQGTPHAVFFTEGKVVSAGNEQHIYQWQLDGKLKLRIQSTTKTIYSLTPFNKMFAACGTSPFIDIYSDLSYKRCSLAYQPSQ